MGGIRGKNKEMPPFNIIDRPDRYSYVIQWRNEENIKKSINMGYKSRDKNEVYKKMEDTRYELVMEWLGKYRGLHSVGTTTEASN